MKPIEIDRQQATLALPARGAAHDHRFPHPKHRDKSPSTMVDGALMGVEKRIRSFKFSCLFIPSLSNADYRFEILGTREATPARFILRHETETCTCRARPRLLG